MVLAGNKKPEPYTELYSRISTEIVSNSGVFAGKASVAEINSEDIRAPYTFHKQEQYAPVPKEIEVKGNKFTYSFPAHSFTQITVKIE